MSVVSMSKSKADAVLEGRWLSDMAGFSNEVDFEKQPFVRTKTINSKNGCFIEPCPYEVRITRHHLRRGSNSTVVHLCWDHHQIIHGVALNKYPVEEIIKVYEAAEKHNLWKEGEANRVKKVILAEIDRRTHLFDNMRAFLSQL